MAFDKTRLSGNITSDGNGAALFIYQTEDTKATVLGADYFSLDRSAMMHMALNPRDIIVNQCSDGLQVLFVTSSNTPLITVIATAAEV